MSRSTREAVAAAVATFLLAGCAGVPTSGPVRQHDPGDQQVGSTVNVAPVPPAAGASAMLVVEGFMHAMGTDQLGFPVARQYLTEAASRAWKPESGTSIYADGDRPRETEASTAEQPVISLGATLTGTLSPRGEYHEASGGLRQDFGLVRTADGQWRISKPPDGLLISRYQFTTNYLARNLHFLDPSGTALVPDPRFFAPSDATMQTLVRAQLAGPGDWLAPAVRRSPATRLDVDRVELSGQGVASVYLIGDLVRLDDASRRTLMAELTATLGQLPLVTGVQLISGATLLQLPGTTKTTLTPEDFEQVAPTDPRSAGRLLTVSDGRVRLVETAQPWTEGDAIAPALTDPGAIAVRDDLAMVAAVSPDATRLSVAGLTADAPTVVLEGRDLLRPDYSRQRELWAIGDRDGAAGFAVFAADDLARIPVTVSGIPEQRVRAFRLSPDGARIALVVDGAEVEQVGVARIVRDSGGIRIEDFRPVTVSPPAEAQRRILDVGWRAATELLVLVSHAAGSSVIRVDQDSARADDIGPAEVAGLHELAVAPNRQPVLRGTGAVFRYESAFNWKLTTRAVEAVTYSG